MADSADRPDHLGFVGDDEIDVLFGTANPNPGRVGCVSDEIIAELAAQRRAIGDPAYEHLAVCSVCYREFRRLQEEGRRTATSASVRWLSWVAAAAVLIVLLVAGAWFYLRAPGASEAPSPTPAPVVAALVPLELDLRPYAVSRSEQPQPGQPPLVLSTDRLALTMLLPIGSEPGAYDARLLDGSSQIVAEASGRADLRDFVTTLEVELDLRATAPGDYLLAVRREGESWSYYPTRLR